MFKVVGVTTMVIDDILAHYEAVFSEGGWTEDMSMANEGMTIIAAIKAAKQFLIRYFLIII